MKSILYALLVILLMTSCAKKVPEVEEGCDCQGPSKYVLKDAQAINYEGGIRVLDAKNPNFTSISPAYCNPDFVKGKALPLDTIYVSGVVRAPCNYGDFNYWPRLEVTAFRKKS